MYNAIRKRYRIDDISDFKEQTFDYLSYNSKHGKSIGDWCEFVGITRATLSKYRKYNHDWQLFIDSTKDAIKTFNEIGVRGCGDLYEYNLRESFTQDGFKLGEYKAFDYFKYLENNFDNLDEHELATYKELKKKQKPLTHRKKGYNRRGFYTKDIELFKEGANLYLDRDDLFKSIGDFCEFMNITRQTLSRYKQRNAMWKKCIEDIKSDIWWHNFMIRNSGIMDELKEYDIY